MKILLMDPSYKHSLGIVRALAASGCEVDVIGRSKHPLASFSRFCGKNHVVRTDPEEIFLGELESVLARESYDVLLPVGGKSFTFVSRHIGLIQKYTRTAVAPIDKLQIAANKKAVYQLAKDIDVPFPATLYPRSLTEVRDMASGLTYPVVIKGLWEAGGNVVDYAWQSEELVLKYENILLKHADSQGDSFPMLQEYVEGVGFGFFAMYQNGVCKRVFMHQRLREYPASGGASSFARSIYDEELMGYGRRLLDALNWHGVAMVEFRADPERRSYKLMEINGKFWGSLDLATASGANFPWWSVQVALGQELEYSDDFRTGVRFQWPFDGDFQRAAQDVTEAPRVLWDSLNPSVKSNIRLTDPIPTLIQGRALLKWATGRMINKMKGRSG